MSDKPLVQQALATDLANIALKIPSIDPSLAFLRGFWDALVREWAGLDRFRQVHQNLLCRLHLDVRISQDGQVLHAHSALRKCFLSFTYARWLESIDLSTI